MDVKCKIVEYTRASIASGRCCEEDSCSVIRVVWTGQGCPASVQEAFLAFFSRSVRPGEGVAARCRQFLASDA